MATTQAQLPIKDVFDDLVLLSDGSAAMIMESGAVNFDLLSEREQLAIIDAFAGFLNSLSFVVQIVIRSRRLDISNYIGVLDAALRQQKNPLLATMMQKYRQFIARTIKENDVLDKQFYTVIVVSPVELGMVPVQDKTLQKAKTVLIPRRDHIIRQFSRIGLKVSQLNNERLIKLAYDLYNEAGEAPPATATQEEQQQQPQPTLPQTAVPTPPTIPQVPTSPVPQQAPIQAPAAPQSTQPPSSLYQQKPRTPIPYVVEELPDDYGTV